MNTDDQVSGEQSSVEVADGIINRDNNNCPTSVTPRRSDNRNPRPSRLRQHIAILSEKYFQSTSVQNGEEDTYADFPYQANYSKALPHTNNDTTGQPDVVSGSYKEMVRILEQAQRGLKPDFSQIDITRPRKLTNPQAGVAFDLQGPDAHAVNTAFFRRDAAGNLEQRSIRPAPRIDDKDTPGQDGRKNNPPHENAAEMIELYWMALMRDIHFNDYEQGSSGGNSANASPGANYAREAANDLDAIKQYFHPDTSYPLRDGSVTPVSLFRGSAPGDNKGPYISQFLYRGNTDLAMGLRPADGLIADGTQKIDQRQRTVISFKDYLTDVPSWRMVKTGAIDPSGTDAFDTEKLRFIRNLRDLSNWVHFDYLYQHFLNAGLILLNEGRPRPALVLTEGFTGQLPLDSYDPNNNVVERVFPLDPGNPYNNSNIDSTNQISGPTFGPPHVLTLLAEVTTRALKAAWYQKWYVHRRNRPEEFGGLLHFQKLAEDSGQQEPYPCLDREILDHRVLKYIFAHNEKINSTEGADEETKKGTYLLPQVFPEGSPTHPSYPSGHATVAGACATILKAFFEEDAPMTDPNNLDMENPNLLPPTLVSNTGDLNTAGTILIPAPPSQQVVLTVGGELNKLASNIAIGRNAAGVHWRSDATEGMLLGEAVAVGVLFEQAFTFKEVHSFTFTTFFTKNRVRIGKERRQEDGRLVDYVVVRIAPADNKDIDFNTIAPVISELVE